MNWLNNLRVARKLALLISVLLVALICVGGTGYYFLSKTNDALNKMYNEKMIALELINENRISARRIETNTFALMLTTDENENKKLSDEIIVRAKQFDDNLMQFERISSDDKTRAEIAEIRSVLEKFRAVRVEAINLAVQNKNSEAYNLYSQQAKPLSEEFTKKLIALAQETKKSSEEMNKQNQKDFAFANMIFLLVIISSIILGVMLGVLITKRIAKRLNDIVVFLKVVSSGDFTREVPSANLRDQSEFGMVSNAVDTMNKNLRKLITQLSHTSEQLAASSEELTASAEQSAQASNQVAGSVTEVAHGTQKQVELANNTNIVVTQISEAIQQVAGNTEIVSASAAKTAATANQGEKAIQQAVSQMKIIEERTNATTVVISELEEKSNQIGQIVEAISNISGQTNLLALNAAIEAARAGEAGKGFAVVAEEVRKLAEQSQEAAKQITDLISDVQTKTDRAVSFMNDGKKEVDTGAQVVFTAGHSFSEILNMVRDMTRQIHEISAAIQEITSGTQNAVHAVQQIDNESKKNSEETQTISAATEEQSASVEEIASASQHLSKMAEELQQAIQKFRI